MHMMMRMEGIVQAVIENELQCCAVDPLYVNMYTNVYILKLIEDIVYHRNIVCC